MTYSFSDYCESFVLKGVVQSTVTIDIDHLTVGNGLASSVSHWLYSLDGVGEGYVTISGQRITIIW